MMVVGDEHSGDYSTQSGSTGHTLTITHTRSYVELRPPHLDTYEFKKKPEPSWAKFQNNFKRKRR